jgi:cytochrome c2
MKYYYLNRIAMAVLVALLLFFGTRTLINIAYEKHEEKPGYEVSGTEGTKPGPGKPSGEAELASLLASGSEKKGAEIAKKCMICHNFEKGGPNMIGPNLYGVLGRPVASHPGYDYSDALKAKAKELGDWDYVKINKMIENPSAFVPGTKMALFPGLPDAQQRADVLLFLRSKNDNPPPLPQAPAAGAPAVAAAPGGETGKPGAAGGGDQAFLAMIAKADPKRGEADTAVCKVCHHFNKGAGALVGPDLYGVVGRKIASVPGFNYTPALKKHDKDTWTYTNLDHWLTKPADFAPGTTMAFPGFSDAKKRADVIAYLRSNAEKPVPLPEAAAAPAAQKPPEAPAAETAPPKETPPAAKQPKATEEAPAETPAEATPPKEPPPTEEKPSEGAASKEAQPSAAPAAPTVSPDAPSEPSKGEPPFASQPQPVYPEVAAEQAPTEEVTEGEEKTIVVPATLSPDAPTEPSKGEPPFASQPQPVYPEGAPEGTQ